MRKTRTVLALAASASFLFAACSDGGASEAPAASEPPASEAPASEAPASEAPAAAKVRLQLQWVPQAQFAGYFAAAEQGYYTAAGIDLEFVPGGPDVIPQAAGSAANGPEFTISWVPKVLEARIGSPASDLVNIAQIFQRSGTLSVSWKESNITSPADFAGKKVGVWDFGNEFEVTAGAKKSNLEAGTDYEKVIQPFDMTLLLSKQIDVAEAMIYNEYAQVLEAVNPETGDLYQPTDLNVINYNDVGTAMLQDALFARASWLAEPGNEEIATNFLKASFQGWIYCRDNPDDCIQYTVNAGSTLGAGHQAWMMNEVNPLIWPSPGGIGLMDPALWQQTVDVSLGAGIITEAPPSDAYRTDLAEAALAQLGDLDVNGAAFTKGVVEVTPGGN
ncbi:MAG: ABC transporter substrate-binding protein [Chloroflexota bacterium]|jgi:NitT/TauT family transport system substrate-binding protein|nr:ABC transporter substrate-binding protein [Chloroflexota bacterium]MDH5243630.1 ABC transporter substrate-binding protein [Chloroflexota bacterium]